MCAGATPSLFLFMCSGQPLAEVSNATHWRGCQPAWIAWVPGNYSCSFKGEAQ